MTEQLSPEQEALVEQVGHAFQRAWNASDDTTDGWLPPIELTDAERNYLARAIIPLIYTAGRRAGREEAAKVAETWQDAAFATDHENRTYADIATAIRNLDKQEEGRG